MKNLTIKIAVIVCIGILIFFFFDTFLSNSLSFFFPFRLSNNEKKLEAVRSGVRAISVSGKIQNLTHPHTHKSADLG